MDKQELERLIKIEKRIHVIAEEEGLMTTDIDFQIAPAQKVIEGTAYGFPTNFSHWYFGQQYDWARTIYEHTLSGIPYEQVWNFERPQALVLATNPFALKVLTIAHVYAHVDFFRANAYCKRGREFGDMGIETRKAAERFRVYEEVNGKKEMERLIDAAFSLQWHQNPDIFTDELGEEKARDLLIARERERLINPKKMSQFQKPLTEPEKEEIEKKLRQLALKTPPYPIYDLLRYIIDNSPKPLKPWMKNVLNVIRKQARSLTPLGRTKMLNEGWATYWHVRIMRRLLSEELITPEEHGVFNKFHSQVTSYNPKVFNWYSVGLAFYEHIEERWNRGQFGKDFEECDDPHRRAYWDTKAGLGKQKIFEVREIFSDRMAVEALFDDDFIRNQKLYIYVTHKYQDSELTQIVENDPAVIRRELRDLMLHMPPVITIEDGNYQDRQWLYLKHHHEGRQELEGIYRDGTLRNLTYLWGRKVFLETMVNGRESLVSCEGNNVHYEKIP